MELNAEQIKKALECCTSTDKTANCPIGCPLGDINSCEESLMYRALSLINSQEQRIKELTEEAYRLECDLQLNADEKAVAKAIEHTRKATVRKMQEKLIKGAFCSACGIDYSHHIIQIAKEMLEDKQCT